MRYFCSTGPESIFSELSPTLMSNFDSYSAKFGREDLSRYVKSMSNGSVSSDGPQEAEKILVVHR